MATIFRPAPKATATATVAQKSPAASLIAALKPKKNNNANNNKNNNAHNNNQVQHHRRLVAVEGLSIEALISQALESYEADATRDLRKIVDQVDKNLGIKEQIRLAQQKMEQYKEEFRNNDADGIRAAKGELQDILRGINLRSGNSSVAGAVAKLRVGSIPEDQEKREQALSSGTIAEVDTALDNLAQTYSDLGEKLQFQLQAANDIYTRASKAKSDVLAKYDQTLNGIAQNFKG